MIVGTGCDLIEIGRMAKDCSRESFLKRVFTEKERELISGKWDVAAGNWCVKEAVAKCFGTGFGKACSPSEIETLRDELGKPYVNLYGKAKETAEHLQIDAIHVSISDSRELAMAFAVAERV